CRRSSVADCSWRWSAATRPRARRRSAMLSRRHRLWCRGHRGVNGRFTVLRRFVFIAAALMLVAAASAQDLVVYSSVDEENARKLLDAFTAETGFQVQMVFLSSGP